MEPNFLGYLRDKKAGARASGIHALGERHNELLPAIPTGSLTLDHAIGIGGIPQGRFVEIVGQPSSGKTTLALHIAREFLAADARRHVIYLDAEHALNPGYLSYLTLDPDRFWIMDAGDAATTLETVRRALRDPQSDLGLVIIDSIAALTTREMLEGEIGDATVAALARLMAQTLRLFVPLLEQRNATLIGINQYRANITPFAGPSYITPGGKAIDFYSSLTLEITAKEAIKQGEERIGSRCVIKVRKNKVGMPFREAAFDLIFGQGIAREREYLALGLELGLVTRKGAWYSLGEVQIGQGVAQAETWLRAHPAETQTLLTQLRSAL